LCENGVEISSSSTRFGKDSFRINWSSGQFDSHLSFEVNARVLFDEYCLRVDGVRFEDLPTKPGSTNSSASTATNNRTFSNTQKAKPAAVPPTSSSSTSSFSPDPFSSASDPFGQPNASSSSDDPFSRPWFDAFDDPFQSQAPQSQSESESVPQFEPDWAQWASDPFDHVHQDAFRDPRPTENASRGNGNNSDNQRDGGGNNDSGWTGFEHFDESTVPPPPPHRECSDEHGDDLAARLKSHDVLATERNHYRVLGLNVLASPRDVDRAHQILRALWSADAPKQQRLEVAYRVLSNAVSE
jgi:hypothetical protein